MRLLWAVSSIARPYREERDALLARLRLAWRVAQSPLWVTLPMEGRERRHRRCWRWTASPPETRRCPDGYEFELVKLSFASYFLLSEAVVTPLNLHGCASVLPRFLPLFFLALPSQMCNQNGVIWLSLHQPIAQRSCQKCTSALEQWHRLGPANASSRFLDKIGDTNCGVSAR